MGSKRHSRRKLHEKLTEIQLASKVMENLKRDGWECYQEVLIDGHGPADIVAVRHRQIWIIETKLSMTLDLIGQAHRWLGLAHFVTMAIPYPKRGDYDKKRFVGDFCRDYGFGLIKVDSKGSLHFDYQQPAAPLSDPMIDYVLNQLCEEHKTFAPAGGRGCIWTPYKSTCQIVKKYVDLHPGCSLESLIAACGQMHYSSRSSAKSTLCKRIAYGAVPGVKLQGYGKDEFLFPDDNNGVEVKADV